MFQSVISLSLTSYLLMMYHSNHPALDLIDPISMTTYQLLEYTLIEGGLGLTARVELLVVVLETLPVGIEFLATVLPQLCDAKW